MVGGISVKSQSKEQPQGLTQWIWSPAEIVLWQMNSIQFHFIQVDYAELKFGQKAIKETTRQDKGKTG